MPFLLSAFVSMLVFAFGCQQEIPQRAESAPNQSQTQANDGAASAAGEKPGPEASSTSMPSVLLTREEIEAGWIQLFDGQSLFGWTPNNDSVNWLVADGLIQADKGEPGLLLTAVPFADYELRCDFKLEEGGNSGIFLRTPSHPKDPGKDCYELNMCDSHPAYATGCFVGRKRVETPVKTDGHWNTFHVTVEGRRFIVRLGDKVILDFTDETDDFQRAGLIGLQKNAGKIEFRNVFLRPLGTEPIFNGKDLSGWREVPGSQSKFEVIDRTIHVTNGRGFWETEQTWADFILQADVISNGKNLNSGIFFRAMPGTAAAPSHGYELQIHNGFKTGDRSQPIDFGTGAIFRRVPARWVVPNDHEWFTVTLAAQGPRFCAWVNGLQVTDWTDQRPPHDNPREGQRLQAGHISLQGHDPTTDLAFRNLRVAAFPKTGKGE